MPERQSRKPIAPLTVEYKPAGHGWSWLLRCAATSVYAEGYVSEDAARTAGIKAADERGWTVDPQEAARGH